MKTVVVGDLHGRWEDAEYALSLELPVIFMGDYVDSFVRDYEDQKKTVQIVSEAVYDGKATALWGNHELSYVNERMQCSGWNQTMQNYFNYLHYEGRGFGWMKNYVWAEGFLISHAGVSNALLERAEITLEEYLKAKDFDQIGWFRGGRNAVGGLYWCDWREFDPVPGVKQIVGHSRQGDGCIKEKDGNYCIDVLEDEGGKFLLIEDGEVEVHKF